MRRALLTVLILFVPVVASIIVYFVVNPKRQPTRREAIGMVVTLAGTGAPGGQDGPNLSATFSDPFGLAVDSKGNIFVAEGGQSNCIRAISIRGIVARIAGSSEGFNDGLLEAASFNTPSGLAIDKRGSVIIADTSNNRIRRLDVEGKVTTVAGSGESGFRDGSPGESRFDGPIGVAVDNQGTIFVADSYNDSIRKIAPDGTVSTWMIEGGTPNTLLRRGFTKNSLKPGTELTVEGYRAKDGANRANGRDLVLPDGKRLFLGSEGTGAPEDGRAPAEK